MGLSASCRACAGIAAPGQPAFHSLSSQSLLLVTCHAAVSCSVCSVRNRVARVSSNNCRPAISARLYLPKMKLHGALPPRASRSSTKQRVSASPAYAQGFSAPRGVPCTAHRQVRFQASCFAQCACHLCSGHLDCNVWSAYVHYLATRLAALRRAG